MPSGNSEAGVKVSLGATAGYHKVAEMAAEMAAEVAGKTLGNKTHLHPLGPDSLQRRRHAQVPHFPQNLSEAILFHSIDLST